MPVAFTPSCGTHIDSERRANRAIFVGNMSYEPNYIAALDIIKKIAPVLPSIEFVIVGRGSHYRS
jgi:glycosyltransferase involved in cell wall biosynthesis